MTTPADTAPVSAVIPCYRCAPTIRRAVESVAAQTRRPAELILVDDASADDTHDVLRAIQDEYGAGWVSIIRLPANRGAAEARNAGWNAASQKYVAFLDADDAWHARKLEVQTGFMEAHPEFGVTGHAHRQVRDLTAPRDGPLADGFDPVGFRRLLLSNQFITPSAMVRRELPARFPARGRHMEDFALWVELAALGVKIARLRATLAYIFKAPYGEGGLSANLVAMERAELGVYFGLHASGRLPLASLAGLIALSLGKFVKRLFVNAARSVPWLFPAAYLTVSHSITALLVLASLLGQQELGAEIGIISGATIATFHAFSANTRMLILARSETLPVQTILKWRLMLLAPLALGAGWLSMQAPGVAGPLIAALVLRRAVEWLNEVHLSDAEVRGDRGLALWFLAGQAALLATVVALLALRSPAFLPALFAWAALPLAFSLPFLGRNLALRGRPPRVALVQLAGHSGSTAVSGLSIYAFRILLLLILGKAAAGDLFAAIAIGSLMGTLVANAIGPSVELQRSHRGETGLPGLIRLAVSGAAAAGLVIAFAADALAGTPFALGKSAFFWRTVGLSLIGGAVMVIAQFVRLRIIGSDDARDVLGPDVLMHMALLAAVPLLAIALGPAGLATIYLVNAVLAYAFYQSAALLRGPAPGAVSARDAVLVGILPALVFLPLFFQLTGRIYDASIALPDSGGVLRTLPLPLSVIACPLALLLIGRYARAALGYGFLFLAFACLTLALIASTHGQFDTATGKLLLLGQCVLPILALPCGMQYAELDRDGAALARAVAAVVATIVPTHLAATWLAGETLLVHRVFVFSIWQHLQYVPVVLALGYGVALTTLWPRRRLRVPLAALGLLVGVYAVAALSSLAMAAVGASVLLFAVQYRGDRDRLRFAAVVAGVPLAILGYLVPASANASFQEKYPRLAEYAVFRALRCSAYPVNVTGGLLRGAGPGLRREVKAESGRLVETHRCSAAGGATFVVTGELGSGTLRLGLMEEDRWLAQRDVVAAGKFRVEIPAENGWVKGVIDYRVAPGERRLDVVFGGIAFEPGVLRGSEASPQLPAPVADPPAPGAVGETLEPRVEALPKNLAERLGDWLLFSKLVFASPTTLFFGQERPLERSVRTSAHNYYIDMAFNFGIFGLIPVLALIALTARRIAAVRSALVRDTALSALLAAVLFIVLVDASFKVTLRQPFPGLAAFFLWGVLLARMRALARAALPPQMRR